MPQYPIPPWDDDQPMRERRRARLGVDNPRFRHLPLVSGDTVAGRRIIEVRRGDPSLSQELLGRSESERLFEFDEDLGHPFYMARNRLDRIRFVRADRAVWVGQLEFFLYSEPFDFNFEAQTFTSIEAATAALRAESERLEALAADGWEVYTFAGSTTRILIDTRRPDENVRPNHLP